MRDRRGSGCKMASAKERKGRSFGVRMAEVGPAIYSKGFRNSRRECHKAHVVSLA